MSHSRIFAGSGSGPTLTVQPNSQPFALEPLLDAVDSVMTCVLALASGLRFRFGGPRDGAARCCPSRP